MAKIMKYEDAAERLGVVTGRIIKTKHSNKHALKTCQGVYTASNRKRGNVNFIYINYHWESCLSEAAARGRLRSLVCTTRRDRPLGLIYSARFGIKYSKRLNLFTSVKKQIKRLKPNKKTKLVGSVGRY